jgi:hypothetical protein
MSGAICETTAMMIDESMDGDFVSDSFMML